MARHGREPQLNCGVIPATTPRDLAVLAWSEPLLAKYDFYSGEQSAGLSTTVEYNAQKRAKGGLGVDYQTVAAVTTLANFLRNRNDVSSIDLPQNRRRGCRRRCPVRRRLEALSQK